MKRASVLAAVVAAVLQSGCGDDKPDPAKQAVVPGGTASAASAPAADDPVARGRLAFKKHGCHQCHSDDGSKGVGPTIKGQFGTERKLVDGSMVVMDSAYIRATLEDPKRAVVAGFTPMMPPYKGKITEPEIDAIVTYIEALR